MKIQKIKFTLTGSGFRSRFFARIALTCPDRFEVAGWAVRKAEKREELGKLFPFPLFESTESMHEKARADFNVCAVGTAATPPVLLECAERNIPVLCETSLVNAHLAEGLEGMIDLYQKLSIKKARIQFSEQYHFQPHHASRLAVVRSGVLGEVSQTQITVSHTVHSASLMRTILNTGFSNATIRGTSFESPIITGPGRKGIPEKETPGVSKRVIVQYQFEKSLGIVDFVPEVHMTEWLRKQIVLIRGSRGEIVNQDFTWITEYPAIVRHSLIRHQTGQFGDLEGNYLKGIQVGEKWVYRNPLAPHLLTDEEIAIGTCLLKMGEYVQSGKEFYPLSEACQDAYLSLSGQKAIQTSEVIQTQTQTWAKS